MVYFVHYADDRQQLNKTCTSLINFEVTRDDLLKLGESEVDSTTEDTYSPIKKKAKLDRPKIKDKKPKKPAGSKSAAKKVEAQAKIEAAKMRAREIFKAKRRLVPLSDSDSEEEQMGIHKQLQEQQQLIERLRKQLQERGE